MPEALRVADHLKLCEETGDWAAQADLEDFIVVRLADQIAHRAGLLLPNEPQVFLAARDAAEDVLTSCKITIADDDEPHVSEEDDERACEAARAAARSVAYRLLRARGRRHRPTNAHSARLAPSGPRTRPRERRVVRRAARARSPGSSDDPSEPDLVTAGALA